ncbi:MAG TPA: hypothetical protein DHV08_15930 [Rhodocyclaceae bacterium]|nr:MAG: hypothetical protein AUK49_05860 [Betaproteobacteria bacterium CG2_30_68_42]PJA56605.1 MAG: hypothetical protein CO164_12190 [Rhodocyclales bacterium CG_4_9_14_3_um_filter_68_10]HCX34884.1 hypothetical protein [Rhodocyclaceae bacterium]
MPDPSLAERPERNAIERRIRVALAGSAIRRIHRLIDEERRDRARSRRIAAAALAIGSVAAVLLALAFG